MHRKFPLPVYALFLCCLIAAAAGGQAQTARSDSSEVLRQLLFMPAPTPRVTEVLKEEEEENARPLKADTDRLPPAETAPLGDLLEYWGRRASSLRRSAPQPTLAVRERLLDAFEAEPENRSHLLSLVPETQAAAARVKKLYDAALNGGQFDESWHESVRKWLQFNSKYFLSELQALARKVKDKDNQVDKQEALIALAKVDWPGAEPVLHMLAESGEQRSGALALALLYRHALEAKEASAEEKYRARLQAIASNTTAPGYARDVAIAELSLAEWAGRDEWYLSLFADETLLHLSDGNFGFDPLTTLFDSEPDKWIPVMTKLVKSKNKAIQQAAASCLVIYARDHPRRDAMLPVLRWLSDPDWLKISSSYRTWFMQKLDAVDIPESVPGLIWIVENETENSHWAAGALARYKDPRAVPALKKALARKNSDEYRPLIIEALVASGGISETEQIAALEAYAAKLTTSEGREEVERYRSYRDEALPVSLSIGKYLARKIEAPDDLVIAVLSHVEALQKKNPAIARELLEIAQKWQARQVYLDMLRRIAAGTADASMIANLLKLRAKLRVSVNAELQSLVGKGGTAQGIAAVLLADETLAQSVLSSDEPSAQTAILACARLVQMPLPIAQVSALLEDENPTLALAAERYLLAEDSQEARRLLWARHEDKAFITGWRENISLIAGNNYDAVGKAEEKLRTELFKEGAPVEIIALLQNSEQPYRVVRIYRDRIVYNHYEDDSRYRERVITNRELEQLKNYIATSNLLEMGPQLNYCHHNCFVAEFLSLTKKQGRRVFSHQGIGHWLALFAHFDLLEKGAGLQTHYLLGNQIKGLEVLLTGESLRVLDVWQRGTDLRVFVERQETPEEAEQEGGQADEDSEDDDEEANNAARIKRQRQALEREKARFSWHAFTKDKPGASLPQPEGYSTFDESAFEIDTESAVLHASGTLETTSGKAIVFAGSFHTGGLWKKTIGQKALPIREEGQYADVLVTPDGKWVVAAKADEHWGIPNYVVRVDLHTNREYSIKLPPADEFKPIAYLRAHGKVLLRRARDESNMDPKSMGPARPEFYLLNAATGETQLVTGVFEPLQEDGKRFLQPTGKPAEFWAAIPDHINNQTRVGRYNLKDFSFQSVLFVPHLIFNSMKMWVDQDAAKLYVVYEGQLLRLPLRIAP